MPLDSQTVIFKRQNEAEKMVWNFHELQHATATNQHTWHQLKVIWSACCKVTGWDSVAMSMREIVCHHAIIAVSLI